ncbi:hypothetical protein PCANB_002915 [Pneumocystis canis]|nr:hypothetical protein PCK1_002898 [Pneumocystis canis]KAG5438426.1 hypothetical protein PCANB_002915 [Pneumocystis canis]
MKDTYLAFLEKTSNFKGKKRNPELTFTSDLLPDSLSSPIIEKLQSYYYSSETDEPFKVVFYELKEQKSIKTILSEKIKVPENEIIEETCEEWDPLKDYSNIIEMVKELSKTNDIKVYKLIQGTKEYIWILGLKIKEGLIGVHTLGVYS